jgi:hypothetical protein
VRSVRRVQRRDSLFLRGERNRQERFLRAPGTRSCNSSRKWAQCLAFWPIWSQLGHNNVIPYPRKSHPSAARLSGYLRPRDEWSAKRGPKYSQISLSVEMHANRIFAPEGKPDIGSARDFGQPANAGKRKSLSNNGGEPGSCWRRVELEGGEFGCWARPIMPPRLQRSESGESGAESHSSKTI